MNKEYINDGWGISLKMLFLFLLALSLMHYETLISLAGWWGSTTKYGHALVIFPVIAYLIYDKRHEFLHFHPQPQPLLLFPLLAFAIFLSIFEIINVQIASETVIIAIIPLAVWLFLGWKITSTIVIPLLLLFMVVPAWELFSPVLTEATATVAYYSLNLLGVPVLREGEYLTIPAGIFQIEEACGGFRYFIAGLSLGLIYAYMFFSSLRQRVLIVLVAITISVVSNWVRVMIVIWAGHTTEMQHRFVHEHVNMGWWIFGIAFLLFFIISNRFSSVDGGEGDARKSIVSSAPNHGYRLKYYIVGVSSIVIVAVIPVFQLLSMGGGGDDYGDEFADNLFRNVAGWEGPSHYGGDWAPRYAGATEERIYEYKKDDASVAVYVAYYVEQDQGNELINLLNTLVNTSWRVRESSSRIFNDINENKFDVVETNLMLPDRQAVMWSWYFVGGRETIDPTWAKLLELRKLFSSSKLSAVIAVLPEREGDREVGEQFLKEFHPEVFSALNSRAE